MISAGGPPTHVLCVDDDAAFVDLTTTYLERQNEFTITTTTSPEEALSSLTESDIDCIVSDYEMPAMDGLELLEHVRANGSDIPFILFTGKGSETIASEAISAGVTDYLQKQSGSEQYELLANRIRNAVATYRADERAHEKSKQILDASPDMVAITVDGKFRYVNNAGIELLEAEHIEEILGRQFEQFIPQETCKKLRNCTERKQQDADIFLEDRLIETIQGTEIPVEVSGRPIEWEGEVGVVSVVRDISARERHRRERERTQSRYKQLVEQIEITSDPERSFEEKLQVLFDLGCEWFDLELGAMARVDPDTDRFEIEYMSDDHPYFEPGLQLPLSETYCTAVTDGRGPASVSNPLKDGYGDIRVHSEFGLKTYLGTYVEVDGGTDRTFFFVSSEPRDGPFPRQEHTFHEQMSQWVKHELEREEQKAEIVSQRDELERQNERLEEFSSFVSHDLQNPLDVAEGYLQLVQEECESEHIDAVAQAHSRIRELTENLLKLAREGQTVSEVTTIPIAEAADKCWTNVEMADATFVADTDRMIRADKSRLQEFFENLIRNAVEHGGEDVTVAVGDLDDWSGFYVEDDGPGIPADNRDDVFRKGYSTSPDGTGFGLAIVNQIAEAHDWEINLTESTMGGARFEITGVEFADC